MVASAKKVKIKKILIIVSTMILTHCAVSMSVTKLVYDNIFTRYDKAAEVPPALEEMVAERENFHFPSGEHSLAGYLYDAPQPEDAYGLILLAPGFNAGGDDYLWQISELRDYGWGVFTFDATGTLQSEGKNQVGFYQTIPDLHAALKYVEKCDCFGYNRVVLLGHSRGAFAACCALEEAENVAAVVSVSGIDSVMEGVMQPSVNAVGWLGYANYGFLWLYQATLFGTDAMNAQASAILSEQNIPALVIHGTEDSQVPMNASSIISHREQITSAQVEYLLCDGGHTDLLFDADGTANDALMEQIHSFLLRSIAN